MAKIYTRTGDDGTTGLVGGKRVAKTSLRVAAYGDVDELSASISLARTRCHKPRIIDVLQSLPDDLWLLMGELAAPPGTGLPTQLLAEARVAELERLIDEFWEKTPPLTRFVVPGSESAAALNVARTVCRRAERSVLALHEREPVRPAARTYLNRLSDLLFAMARFEDTKERAL